MLRKVSRTIRSARLYSQAAKRSSAVLKNGDIKIGEGVLLAKAPKERDAEIGAKQEERGPLKKGQAEDADKKRKIDQGIDVNQSASS